MWKYIQGHLLMQPRYHWWNEMNSSFETWDFVNQTHHFLKDCLNPWNESLCPEIWTSILHDKWSFRLHMSILLQGPKLRNVNCKSISAWFVVNSWQFSQHYESITTENAKNQPPAKAQMLRRPGGTCRTSQSGSLFNEQRDRTGIWTGQSPVGPSR